MWGNLFDDDNIVWGNLSTTTSSGATSATTTTSSGGTLDDDNIVWGNARSSAGVSWSGGRVVTAMLATPHVERWRANGPLTRHDGCHDDDHARRRRSAPTGSRACRCCEGKGITLRELRLSDATALLALLTTEEVTRFISPPPTTIEGFERFIAWAGASAKPAVTSASRWCPTGTTRRSASSRCGSWIRPSAPRNGALRLVPRSGAPGCSAQGAELVVEFAFDVIGVHRLEARAAVQNGRGNGALRKVGAVQEGILRKSFLRGGKYHDQALWAIIERGLVPLESRLGREGQLRLSAQ